ncbi:MAG: hypothetical protein Q4G33_03315 [bacterium]|nr:hypothetical protein [bacterium]
MKNVKNYTLQSRMLAFILAFAMVIGVCPAAFAAGEKTVTVGNPTAEFTGTGVEDGTASTGQAFGMHISAGFNADVDGVEEPELRVYIGNMEDTSFVSFTGKFAGDSAIIDDVKYTVQYDSAAGEKYLLVEKYDKNQNKVVPWVGGDTINAVLGAKFDRDAKDGTEWNIYTKVVNPADGIVISTGEQHKVTAESDVVMNNTKSVNTDNIAVGAVSGATMIDSDIVYHLSAYTGTEPDSDYMLAVGEAPVTEYTVTDTFTLPAGLYISGTDENALKSALSADFDYTVKNITTDNNCITGFTIEHTETNANPAQNQVSNFSGNLTVLKDKIQVSADFNNTSSNKAEIKNEIGVSYKTVNSPEGQNTAPVSAVTTVYRPSSAAYSEANKSIEGVYDEYNTYNWGNGYLIEGDYVLYKVSFKNSGETALSNGTITDALPEGLSIVTNLTGEAKEKVKNKLNKNWEDLYSTGAHVDSGTANVAINGNTVTFSNISVEANTYFTGYILAKITGAVNSETVRTNTAVIDDDSVTAKFKQNPKSAKIGITKTVVNSSRNDNTKYSAGDQVEYIVTVSNSGSADAQNVKITDLFPSGVIDVESVKVGDEDVTQTVTVTGDDKAQAKTYDFGSFNIPSKGMIVITFHGKVKDGVKDSQINNHAEATYNGSVVKADAILQWDNPAAYVNITKSGDKDGSYVAAGDKIKYTIKVDMGTQTFDTEVPLVIKDIIPSGLTVDSSTYEVTSGSSSMTPSNNQQEYTYTITGSGTGVITIVCTVGEDAVDGTEIKNTAYVVGGNSNGASSGKALVGSANQYPVEKTAEIWHNGEKVGDIASGATGAVQPGDTLKFKIKVTNNSGADVTRIDVSEKITGRYNNSQDIKLLKVTRITAGNGAYGVDRSYDSSWTDREGNLKLNGNGQREIYIDSNQNDYGSGWYAKKGTEGTIILTNNMGEINQYNQSNYHFNPDFKIENGGSIIIECEAVLSGDTNLIGENDTTTASNSAWVGNDTPSTVYYTTQAATPTAKPGETEAPVTPNPNMPTLKIEKSVSRTFGGEAVKEIVFKDKASLTSSNSEVMYTVKVTNDSPYPYTASNAAILDQLPAQFGLKAQETGSIWIQENNSVHINSRTLATVDEEADYKTAEWKTTGTIKSELNLPDTDVFPQNWLAVGLETDTTNHTLTIPANSYFTLVYALKLKPSAVEQIENEIGNGPFEFDQQTASNTAYFTGDTDFKNSDGTVTKVIVDSESVVLRSSTVHPGVQKTAYAYLEPAGDSFTYSSYNAHPGARLIWKLKVVNDKDTNNTGETMTKYTLTDVLPERYQYVENQTYTNQNNVTYPSGLSGEAEQFKNGKIIKHCENGEIKELDVPTPTMNGSNPVWSFDSTSNPDYELKPGEYLEFLLITEPTTESWYSGVYYNKALLQTDGKYYEDTIKVGAVDEDGNISDGDNFSINTILTSANISVTTSTGATAQGGTENNVAEGEAGKEVTYTLTVKNDDGTGQSIKNVSIINRLPYVGDSGVIVSGQRGSEFDVTFAYNLKVEVHRNNGTTQELTSEQYTLTTYSGDTSKSFTEASDDWTKYDVEGWSDEWDASSKLIRVMVGTDEKPITLANGEYITVTYNAKLPEDGGEKDQTAWNNFAYHYDAVDGATNMAAEPASVGVKLPANTKLTGNIRVKKVFSSPNKEAKIFYFAVFDKPYTDGAEPLAVKPISVTSSGKADKPSNAEFTFTDLPYTAIGHNVNYYIYETDANGVPLAQSKTNNGYVMSKGFYRPEKGTYTTLYDANNTANKNIAPTDDENIQYVYATDEKGSNKVEYVKEGGVCYWVKGLSPKQTTNSAIFTNFVPEEQIETTKTIYGPYYADVATNFDAANNPGSGMTKDNLTTGVVTERGADGTVTNRDERDDNTDANRNIKTTYDSGREISSSAQYNFGNGWGNEEGHTVSTGFMARITGGTGGTTINKVMWDITSNPLNSDGVFVKLSDSEYSSFSQKMSEKGYDLEKMFNDGPEKYNSSIYKIVQGTSEASLTSADSAVDMDVSDDHDSGIENEEEEGATFNANDDDISFSGDDDEFLNVGDDAMDAMAELNEVTCEPLNWKITDSVPAITLGAGASVNIGIIIDQIYDKNAIGDIVLNPTDAQAENATAAENAKIENYGPQSDVPAFNLSGEYQTMGIENVLQPLSVGTYTMGASLFNKGDVTSIISNNGEQKYFMLCAGDYYEEKADGTKSYKNNITINDDNIRIGSFQYTKDYSIVNKQPTPAIAVKIPEGGVRLTFDLDGGTTEKPRYLTILHKTGEESFGDIPEIRRNDLENTNATQLKVNYDGEQKPYIDISTTGVVYITSTSSNINIKSIEVSAIPAN